MSARRLLACTLAATAAPAAALSIDVPAAVSASASSFARAAGATPSVQSMIVGSGGTVLFPERTVTASTTTVSVAHRSCAVEAGTPLAVLAAMRRGGGPQFSLRDYGHCGSSPVNSAELFVYTLGGESNTGQSGWEYKVDGVSGSTGAADPSGPSGNGHRLSSGERVLWFWCQASGGGCQRTLALAAATTSVSPGRSLTVTVSAQDNEGHGAPVAGAIVTLGSDFASTATSGRATLIAPSTPGSYQLTATRAGLVPSFPETIVVR
jgi:hypothetical protein